MAKFSDKRMGKEVGNAAVYAQPHTMSGKAVGISSTPGKEPNHSKADTVNMSIGAISKAAGDEQVKTTGIKIRGTGAATKGLMARGPMA
jgi:hypothetical protein